MTSSSAVCRRWSAPQLGVAREIHLLLLQVEGYGYCSIGGTVKIKQNIRSSQFAIGKSHWIKLAGDGKGLLYPHSNRYSGYCIWNGEGAGVHLFGRKAKSLSVGGVDVLRFSRVCGRWRKLHFDFYTSSLAVESEKNIRFSHSLDHASMMKHI